MAIEVKEAVQIAKDALGVVFESEQPHSIRLEEVVLNDSSDWVITLSYFRTSASLEDASPMAVIGAALSHKRVYKVLTVSKSGGEVKSIKMREDG